jgi:hypothetical protein
VKPSVTQIAHAFKVDPAHVLDTRVRGNHPPLLFARAAFMALTKRAEVDTPLNTIAKRHGFSISTPYRWLLMHRQYVSGNPVYAATFAKLAGEAA